MAMEELLLYMVEPWLQKVHMKARVLEEAAAAHPMAAGIIMMAAAWEVRFISMEAISPRPVDAMLMIGVAQVLVAETKAAEAI